MDTNLFLQTVACFKLAVLLLFRVTAVIDKLLLRPLPRKAENVSKLPSTYPKSANFCGCFCLMVMTCVKRFLLWLCIVYLAILWHALRIESYETDQNDENLIYQPPITFFNIFIKYSRTGDQGRC
jgi:hypothetical protein